MAKNTKEMNHMFFSCKKLKELENEIGKDGLPINFKIPNNYLTLVDAIGQAKPLAITNPQANITKAFKNIAKEFKIKEKRQYFYYDRAAADRSGPVFNRI